MMRVMSQAWPNRCTARMALVRGVMAASIFSASMLSYRSGSTNTGVAPFMEMPMTQAM